MIFVYRPFWGQNPKCAVFGYNNFKSFVVLVVLIYKTSAVLTKQKCAVLFCVFSQVCDFMN